MAGRSENFSKNQDKEKVGQGRSLPVIFWSWVENYLPTKSDRTVFAIASFFALLLGVIFILDPDWAHYADDSGLSTGRTALIVERTNDVRAKKTGTLFWSRARPRMPLNVGDSIFVGSKSNSAVRFMNGLNLKLGENTLLSLAGDEDNPILELHQGEIQVDPRQAEKLAIKIGTEVIRVDTRQQGLGSLQIRRQERGPAEITSSGNKKVELKITSTRGGSPRISTLTPDTPSSLQTNLQSFSTPTEPIRGPLVPILDGPNFYSRPYRYSDWYSDARLGRIQRKPLAEGQIIAAAIKFDLIEGDLTKPLYFQVSSNPDFSNLIDDIQLPIATREAALRRLSFSTSFIRFSHDRMNWTRTESLPISLYESSLLPVRIKPPSRPSLIEEGLQTAMIPIEFERSDERVEFLVIEASSSEVFPTSTTQVFLKPFSAEINIELAEGRHFIRSRGLLAEGTLTPYSETQSHQVARAPRLALIKKPDAPTPKPAEETVPVQIALPERAPAMEPEPSQASVLDLPPDYRTLNPLSLTAYFHLGTLSLSANTQVFGLKIPQSSQASFIRSGLVLNRMPVALEAFVQSSSGGGEFKDNRFGAGLNYWLTRKSAPFGFIAQYYRQSRSELIGDFSIDFMKLGSFLGFKFTDNLSNYNEISYGINTKGGSLFGLQTALNYQFNSSFRAGIGAATENFGLTLDNFNYQSTETSIFSRIQADF